MVFDQLQNLSQYVTKEQFQKIDSFLQQLSPDMKEGFYEIDGEAIYARVMSYPTSLRRDCRIEAHDKYIDIQSSLAGMEGIDIFERDRLSVLDEYDEERDVVFFEETIEPNVTVRNKTGYFSMIYPGEAHRPQISVNQQCETVKKFVIKIRI